MSVLMKVNHSLRYLLTLFKVTVQFSIAGSKFALRKSAGSLPLMGKEQKKKLLWLTAFLGARAQC